MATTTTATAAAFELKDLEDSQGPAFEFRAVKSLYGLGSEMGTKEEKGKEGRKEGGRG